MEISFCSDSRRPPANIPLVEGGGGSVIDQLTNPSRHPPEKLRGAAASTRVATVTRLLRVCWCVKQKVKARRAALT